MESSWGKMNITRIYSSFKGKDVMEGIEERTIDILITGGF